MTREIEQRRLLGHLWFIMHAGGIDEFWCERTAQYNKHLDRVPCSTHVQELSRKVFRIKKCTDSWQKGRLSVRIERLAEVA